MATFKYTAISPEGVKVRSSGDAPSAAALRNELTLRRYDVLKVKEKVQFASIEISKERVPRQVIMHFSRQLAAFVRGGIPLTDALTILEDGGENKRWAGILADVQESLRSGRTFAEALSAHASVFPPYYLGIVRSSEHTGQLDVVLEQLAEYMERDIESKQRLRAAIAYPAVIALAAVAVVVLMAEFVLPRLTQFFKQFGVKEPPLTARILIQISDFFKNQWYVVPALLILVLVTVLVMKRTDRGRRVRDSMLLRTWFIGDIVRYAAVERFCRIISAMMRAGVPLPDAMRASLESVNNKVFEDRLEAVNEAVLEGEGLAGPIARASVFPRAAVQMMRVGEETGSLDHQLQIACDYYSSELEYKLKKLMSFIEPAIIIFMGIIVGFVAVTMIQSIYGMVHGSNLVK